MDQLDQQHERIQADLRGLIDGEVCCDAVLLQLYASDGSIYEIKPLGVVRPRSTSDVVACVQYAAEMAIPIHARGAGTGLAGESLGSGLVLDFSRHLRRVLRTGSKTVRVQPGIVHDRLNAHLEQSGRIFGPDPATGRVSTIGSLIAIDGAGRHWLKYGSARDCVRGMQVVLADGQLLEVGREPLESGSSRDANLRKRELVNQLAQLLRRHAGLIAKQQSKSPIDRCGYNLQGILGEGYLDLAGLLVGSEGTLALTTEALLATEPLPLHRGVVLLMFDSLEKASRAVMEVLPHRPSACDLMDRRHLSLARETEARFDPLIPRATEALLLVEQEGEEAGELHERLQRLVDDIQHRKHLAFDARQAFDPAEVALFRRLAVRIQPALYRMKSPARPVPIVEDVAVPPEVLPDFLVKVQNLLKRHQITAALSCHAGQGQLHIYPLLDLADGGDLRKMRDLAGDLYEEVFGVGGTISGERGCGLSRSCFVSRQCGELYNVFRQVKRIFDPEGILNPGKIVGDDDPQQLIRNLRPAVVTPGRSADQPGGETQPAALRDLVELQLNWDPAQVAVAARACNGCGECRSQAPNMRMCPIFRALPAEESSPRAKANLIRGVLAGRLQLSHLTSEEFKRVADLCVNCHMCVLECPAAVDIPNLVARTKGAYVESKGLHFADWAITRLDLVSAVASLIAPLANWSIGNRQMRWLMEKTLGIAQGRKLPRVASRSFLRRAARRRLVKPSRHGRHKVAYFVDLYANYYDPQLAEALVAVLEHNGVAVYVPPEQLQAGVPAISSGSLELARSLAAHNTAILAEAVRQGYHVVATEPAAALCLVREYPGLLDNDDVRLVAEHTSDACSYLWKIHTLGKLQLDLDPINAVVGYHMPCRLKALEVGSPGENLLRLIPGLSVQVVEEGCSGMAGTFGLMRANYRTSLRAGWGLISRLRNPDLQAGATDCSACKIQMEQGTTKPTLHPIKLLALSYGLLGDAAPLTATGEELIVT